MLVRAVWSGAASNCQQLITSTLYCLRAPDFFTPCAYCVRMVCRRHVYMMYFGQPSSPRFYMVHQHGLVCVLPLIVPDSTRSFAGVSATTTVPTTFQLLKNCSVFSDADDTPFERFVYYPAHVLHPILPAKSEQPYSLRERRHNYCLVEKISLLNERDYITRILYKDSY